MLEILLYLGSGLIAAGIYLLFVWRQCECITFGHLGCALLCLVVGPVALLIVAAAAICELSDKYSDKPIISRKREK